MGSSRLNLLLVQQWYCRQPSLFVADLLHLRCPSLLTSGPAGLPGRSTNLVIVRCFFSSVAREKKHGVRGEVVQKIKRSVVRFVSVLPVVCFPIASDVTKKYLR